MASRLEIGRAALVLLAAGQSRRFGVADKLAADLNGRPLGLHVVETLGLLPFAARVAVVGATALDYAAHGFRVVVNPDPARGMASSLRLGVAAALDADADAVLVVLADMPRVTATQMERLFAASDGPDTVVGSSEGGAVGPPALFGRTLFEQLLALDGERGARDLIRAGRLVEAKAGELVDVDTPEELTRLRNLLPSRLREGSGEGMSGGGG